MATSVASSLALSDISEETPPGRSEKVAPVAPTGRRLDTLMSSGILTAEEKKKEKELLCDKYFKLMEKYGPKRRTLFANTNNQTGTSEGTPAVKPVGFVIKFRLSHAYKALEKQEIEAAQPTIKPVRRRKYTKFLLPDERPEADLQECAAGTESVGTVTATATATVTANVTAVSVSRVAQAGRKLRIQIKGGSTEKKGLPGCEGGMWTTLTQQKASVGVLRQEREHRKQALRDANVSWRRQGQSQGQQGQKQDSENEVKPTHREQKDSDLYQVVSVPHNVTIAKQAQCGKNVTVKVMQAGIVEDGCSRGSGKQNQKSCDLLAEDFAGAGMITLPGSLGATTEYSCGDSAFRMFSDSAFSGSMTMDALTVGTVSRPSSSSAPPAKSALAMDGARPVSGRSRKATRSMPKPQRTSTPTDPPTGSTRQAASSGQTKPKLKPKPKLDPKLDPKLKPKPKSKPKAKPKPEPKPPTAQRRPKSATTPGGNSEKQASAAKSSTRCLSAILRDGRNAGGEARREVAERAAAASVAEGTEGAPRQVVKYLYHMGNCHQVARKTTLAKLFKLKKVSGVIDVFGCPEKQDPRADNMLCPFCQVMPRKRINAWLDNLEDD